MATPKTFTDLDIVNQALVGRMGEDRISNLATDQTTRAVVMREHYDQVKEACLTRTAWRFATAKAALSKLSAAPTNRWEAAWQLPVDKLKVLFVWPPIRYEIQGQRIYSDLTSGLEIDYIRLVPEAEWPAWFRKYVIEELVQATKKGITGDAVDAADDKAHARAESEALTADAQQQPNQTELPNPFIDCRY